MNIVLIRHDNFNKDYLFQTPTALHHGDRVLCDTSRGEQYGTAQCDSIQIGTDHNSQVVLEILVRITGATLPLKSIVGRETKTVERFTDKPAEPKQAANKYEGMSDKLLSYTICAGKDCGNWGVKIKQCPSDEYCSAGKGSFRYISEHRAEAIAAFLAEDEAKSKTGA